MTGATGYLGSELVRLRPDATTERVEVLDALAVSELFERLRPDVVIHTAYRQEEDDVNTVGSENVAARGRRGRRQARSPLDGRRLRRPQGLAVRRGGSALAGDRLRPR